MAGEQVNLLKDPQQVKDYVREKGWLHEVDHVHVEALHGGVSNQVWKIAGANFSWVMKQALPKLKVQADWYADVNRIKNESAAMQTLHNLLDDETVPKLLHKDEQYHIYVMSCAPEGSATWKEELMQGQFDSELAARAGALMSRIHRQSALHEEEIRARFDDLAFFTELRLDPFHRYIGKQYPALAPSIDLLIRQLTEQRSCLVHGDFSPKNMLVAPDRRLILLDFEVAHWGNPLFDVSFCMAHLMLKGWALKQRQPSIRLIEGFLDSYVSEMFDVSELLPHLGLMLLARLDGKSTVDYVRDEHMKQRIRETAYIWLENMSQTEDVMSNITKAMKGR